MKILDACMNSGLAFYDEARDLNSTLDFLVYDEDRVFMFFLCIYEATLLLMKPNEYLCIFLPYLHGLTYNFEIV